MRNFDEPIPVPDDPNEPEPATRDPRVDFIGDPASIARAFQASAAFGTTAAAKRAAEALSLPTSTAIKDAQAALAKSVFSDVKLPKVDMSALIRDIPKVDIPKLDLDAMHPRVPPLEIDLPEPVRPIADVRLEALVDAVNQLIDLAQAQNEALLGLNKAMEARHVESEQTADDRAGDANNLARWGVTFAGLAALIVVIELLFR